MDWFLAPFHQGLEIPAESMGPYYKGYFPWSPCQSDGTEDKKNLQNQQLHMVQGIK